MIGGRTRIEEAPFVMGPISRPLPHDAPVFCPVCGRPLEYSFWDTVENSYRYCAFICYGGNRWAWLHRRWDPTYPGGTHYQYHFGPYPLSGPEKRFDALTGKPIPHGFASFEPLDHDSREGR